MAFPKLGALIERIASTATSGGTLNLANNSASYQRFTGTSNHTVVLPQANAASPNECPVGLKFMVMNRSTGTITVNLFGGTLLVTVAAGEQKMFRLTDNSSSTGSWDATVESGSAASFDSAALSAMMAGLADAKYLDSQTESTSIKVLPEEIGGNYWIKKTSLPSARSKGIARTLNGFCYNVGGADSGSNPLNFNTRYSDDSNFYLERQAITVARSYLNSFSTDSRIYVVGGATNSAFSTFTATMESFNDSTNTWGSLASITTNTNRAAGASDGNYGFIIGGSTTTAAAAGVNLTYLYDTVSNFWVARSNIIAATRSSTNAFSRKGEVYVAGGVNTAAASLSSVEKYSVEKNSWESAPSMSQITQAAFSGSAIGLGFMSGGYDGSNYLTTNQQFNFETRLWEVKSPRTIACQGFGQGDALNGFLHTFGGDILVAPPTSESYSYVSSSFFQIPILKKSLAVPTSILASVAINGVAASLPVRLRTDGDVWKYFEANKNGALKLGETLASKFNYTGNVYVAQGGNNAGTVSLSSIEFYNSASNSWSNRTGTVHAAYSPASFPLDGYAHSVAGASNLSSATSGLNTHNRYSETLDVSVSRTALPVSLFLAYGYPILGVGYVASGSDNVTGAAVTSNYAFNPSTNSWATKAVVITTTFSQNAAFSIDDRGVLTSGNVNSGGGQQSTTVVYNAISDSWANAANAPSADRQVSGFSQGGFGYRTSGVIVSNVATHKLNLSTNSWSTVASLASDHTNGGNVSANGYGYCVSGNNNQVVERYSSEANSWTTLGSVGTLRRQGTMGFSPGPYRNYQLQVGLPTYLAAVGSWSVITKAAPPVTIHGQCAGSLAGYLQVGYESTDNYRYDPSVNAYTRIGNTPAITGNNAGMSLQGFGYSQGNPSPGASTAVYSVNPSTWLWTTAASLASSVIATRMCALDGFGWASGSTAAGASQTAVQKLTLSTNSWSTVGNLGTARARHGFCPNASLLFAVGADAGSTSGEKYNPVTNSSSSITAYPLSISRLEMLSYGDSIFGMGGDNGASVSSVYEYKVSLNAWATKPNLSTAEVFPSGGLLGSSFFLAASATQQYASAIKNVVLGAALRVGE